MRKLLAGPVKARRGQTVIFSVKLKKGMRLSFCEIYSSVGDFPPSPHTPFEKMLVRTKEPQMLAATTLRVTDLEPYRELWLTADETCKFYLMQEVDVLGDPLAKGKIRIHGKFNALRLSARRWLRRITGR